MLYQLSYSRAWSGRLDLNQRPPAPKAGALPACATPRGHGQAQKLNYHAEKGGSTGAVGWYTLAMRLGPLELLLILLVVLLLFGARKLPELARGIGQSAREFKKGLSEGEEKKEEPKA